VPRGFSTPSCFLSYGIRLYHWCNYHGTFTSSSVSIWPYTGSQRRKWGKPLNSKLIRLSAVFHMPHTSLTMHNTPSLLLWIISDIKWQVLSAGHWSGPKLENWPWPSWSRNFSPLWHPNVHHHIHSGLSVYLSQLNPLHTYMFSNIRAISFSCCLSLVSYLNKILCAFLICWMHATYPIIFLFLIC